MDFLDGGRDRFGEAVDDVEPGNPAQLCHGAGPPFCRVFHELLVLAFQFFRLAFDAGFDRCQLLEVHGVSFVFDEYPVLAHHGDLVSDAPVGRDSGRRIVLQPGTLLSVEHVVGAADQCLVEPQLAEPPGERWFLLQVAGCYGVHRILLYLLTVVPT